MKIVIDNSIETEGERAWLVEHKTDTGLSWREIGRLTDVAASTLSLFSTDKYKGDNQTIATHVAAYRKRLGDQEQIGAEAPMVPEWFETPTSQRLEGLFRWAQSGKIVLIVTVPGVGKTRTAERFVARDPNAWLATMSPATAGVATMASEVAAAIGLGEITGSPQQLSRQIRAQMAGKAGLLLVDEAQELTDKALNEIRGWHDRTKVGVVLMGNEKVVGQLDSRKSALAQVSSRFSMRHVQMEPMPGDTDALLDAWGITDEAQRDFLARIGNQPGALREMTHTIEVALMMQFSGDEPLSVALLRRAAKQRNSRVGGL